MAAPGVRKALQLAICRYLSAVKEPRTLIEIRRELRGKFPRDEVRLRSIDVLKDLRILRKLGIVVRSPSTKKDLKRVEGTFQILCVLTDEKIAASLEFACGATKYVYRTKEHRRGDDKTVPGPGRYDDSGASRGVGG